MESALRQCGGEPGLTLIETVLWTGPPRRAGRCIWRGCSAARWHLAGRGRNLRRLRGPRLLPGCG